MAKKSKQQSVPARRSSPRTRSGAAPEPISTPATCSRFAPKPNSEEIPRTPFSAKAITPITGTRNPISLSDWWLTNEKGLGVAGFESKGGSKVRLFSSATISTRHDSTTLETSDGLTVSISGFINRSRSLQNGFSSQVCSRFLLGFPYHWKDYAEQGFVEEEEDEKDYQGVSFDDIHVTRLQDVLLTASPRFQDKIFDHAVASLRDLLRSGAEKPDKDCERSGKECRTPRMDGGGDDESSVVSVVGVRTRGMVRRREEDEASIGERLHRSSQKKRGGEEKVKTFY